MKKMKKHERRKAIETETDNGTESISAKNRIESCRLDRERERKLGDKCTIYRCQSEGENRQ